MKKEKGVNRCINGYKIRENWYFLKKIYINNRKKK